ncbi:hypothetical protein EW146_g6886 [Bondarzewia mesenterica]|uniref:F-box domain-containing protein n=1 Tax=Bondarzewia mesenterica TaxID=1095465 RepID=A0A4S4LSZ6_9AGAM|nr:hypothetical protein EW146_g6886 [Bondarzewia mesenterica]
MSSVFPPEILREIMRSATLVTEAFDTRMTSILHEHRGAVYASIYASLATKRTLSLVSRQFHALATEFLYEILVIRSYRHLFPLLKLLRECDADPTRGWWVRRIDLDLSVDEYEGQGWAWGRDTLFGLVPSCPNLEVLIASIVTPCGAHGRHFIPLSADAFAVPTNLLKCIIACCASLRRLEILGQMAVNADEAEMVVGCLPRLEAARFSSLCEPRTQSAVFDADSEGAPVDPSHSSFKALVKSFTSPSWPTPTMPNTSSPLHTLDCGEFIPGITNWTLSLPSLRLLNARLSRWTGPTQLPTLRLTIRSPTSPFITLTHLVHCGPPFNVWSLLDSLPLLQWLSLDFPRGVHRTTTAIPPGSTPHAHLAHLILLRESALQSDSHSPLHAFPRSVLQARKDALLPALASIQLAGLMDVINAGRIEYVWALQEDFRKEGIRVQIGSDPGYGEYERGATVWANYGGRG